MNDILNELSKEPYGSGCILGLNKVTVQAYADDLVLISPSAAGLRYLLRRCEALICRLDLVLNPTKTRVVVFERSIRPTARSLNFYLGGSLIESVDSFKYLGSILNFNLNECLDIDRLMKSFSKSVGMFFRKFGSSDFNVKWKLFNSLCLSLYGSELWADNNRCLTILNNFAVFYHSALKKILGVPRYFSNHFVCSELNVHTFDHFFNFKLLKFLFWLDKCN